MAKTVGLRIDGAQVASASLGSQTISALDGARELRIGATGAPGATTPDCQYAGDIREVLLFGTVLTGTDLTTVESWLLAQAAG